MSVAKPNSSRPNPLVFGFLPTAIKTTSASICFKLLVSVSLIDNITLPSTFLTLSKEWLSLNLIPCFCNIFINLSATSVSIPGNILGRNSITSTSEPSLLQTVPISRPITPAPITISFLGTFFKSKAPVEVTICVSSMSILGRIVGVDPVAIIIFSACMFSVFPLLLISISLEEMILAVPKYFLTLFLLKR